MQYNNALCQGTKGAYHGTRGIDVMTVQCDHVMIFYTCYFILKLKI